MLWAKLWTDILGDPKLMRAARRGARNLNLTPWLLAFAKEANDDGRLSVGGSPADPEDISDKIPGCKPREVTVCCIHLAEASILTRDEDGAYRFTNWSKRQGAPSDSPSAVANRVRKHRAKKRGGNGDGNALQVVAGNETEIEEEIEIEQELEEERKPPVTSAAAKSGRELFLERLTATKRVGIERTLENIAQGYDLQAGTGIPTTAQIDRACTELLGSCDMGTVTAKAVSSFVSRIVRDDREPARPDRPRNGKALTFTDLIANRRPA